MHRFRYFALLAALIATSLFAADAAERKFIREGMSEGEVLLKLGKPDSESNVTPLVFARHFCFAQQVHRVEQRELAPGGRVEQGVELIANRGQLQSRQHLGSVHRDRKSRFSPRTSGHRFVFVQRA